MLLLAKSASLLYPTLTMKALRVNFFFPNEGSLIIAVTISDTKLQAIYFLHYKPRSNPNEVAFDFDISSCKKKKGGGGKQRERGKKKEIKGKGKSSIIRRETLLLLDPILNSFFNLRCTVFKILYVYYLYWTVYFYISWYITVVSLPFVAYAVQFSSHVFLVR